MPSNAGMKSVLRFFSVYATLAARGYRGDFRGITSESENQTLEVSRDSMQLSVHVESIDPWYSFLSGAGDKEKCCCKEINIDDGCEGALKLRSKKEKGDEDYYVCCKKVIIPKNSCKIKESGGYDLSMNKVQSPTNDDWSRKVATDTMDMWGKTLMSPPEPVASRTGRHRPPPPLPAAKAAAARSVHLQNAIRAISGEKLGAPWGPSVSFSNDDCSVNIVVDIFGKHWVHVPPDANGGVYLPYKIPAVIAALVSALRSQPQSEFPEGTGTLRKGGAKGICDALTDKITNGKISEKDLRTTDRVNLGYLLKERLRSMPVKLLDFVPPPPNAEPWKTLLTKLNSSELVLKLFGTGPSMINDTPEPMRSVIKYLFGFLLQMVNSAPNKDTLVSIATVMAENLISDPPEIAALYVPKAGMSPKDLLATNEKIEKGVAKKVIVMTTLLKAYQREIDRLEAVFQL